MEGADEVDDEYGAELDAMVQETESQIQKKEIEKPKQAEQPPAQQKSFLQSAVANANTTQNDEKPNKQEEIPDFDEMDKMMQQLFSAAVGTQGAEGGGAAAGSDQQPPLPDIANIANLLGQFGGAEGGIGDEVNEDKVQEAQKLFKDCIDQIQKETKEYEQSEKTEGAETQQEPKEGEQKEKPDLSDPKGEGLGQLGDMFKDFDRIAKEQNDPNKSKGSTKGPSQSNASTAGQQQDPFANLFSQMGAPGATGNPMGGGPGGQDPFDDPQMMNMFKGLLGNLGEEGGQGGASGGEGAPKDQNAQMNDLFKQFTSFLQESEGQPGDEGFKGALDSVVKEIISKDSLYGPMKNLKEAYPGWLEENWQSLSDEDLERYNNQLDKVTEICDLFERPASKEDQKVDKKEDQEGGSEKKEEGEQKDASKKEEEKPEVFDLLSQLQELGHPPADLMKQIQEKQGLDPNAPTGLPGFGGAQGNPFADLLGGGSGADGQMPPEMQQLFANLASGVDQPQSSSNNQNQSTKTEEPPKFNNPYEDLD